MEDFGDFDLEAFFAFFGDFDLETFFAFFGDFDYDAFLPLAGDLDFLVFLAGTAGLEASATARFCGADAWSSVILMAETATTAIAKGRNFILLFIFNIFKYY